MHVLELNESSVDKEEHGEALEYALFNYGIYSSLD